MLRLGRGLGRRLAGNVLVELGVRSFLFSASFLLAGSYRLYVLHAPLANLRVQRVGVASTTRLYQGFSCGLLPTTGLNSTQVIELQGLGFGNKP